MSEIIKTNTEYSKWIKEVSLRFRNSQIKAATKVNREMLLFYWSIGHDISACCRSLMISSVTARMKYGK